MDKFTLFKLFGAKIADFMEFVCMEISKIRQTHCYTLKTITDGNDLLVCYKRISKFTSLLTLWLIFGNSLVLFVIMYFDGNVHVRDLI